MVSDVYRVYTEVYEDNIEFKLNSMDSIGFTLDRVIPSLSSHTFILIFKRKALLSKEKING